MWHIGQDIVCIKSHSKGLVKEGDVFTIKGIRGLCCETVFDIGKHTDCIFGLCECGELWDTHLIAWFNAKLFKPLDELSDISELLEVLELETVI